MVRDDGTPINHILFMPRQIAGTSERPVQVALDDVASNILQLGEGPLAQETAVYQAALQKVRRRPLLVRDETAPGFDDLAQLLTPTVDPILLHNYLQANQTSVNPRFLFQGSSRFFVTPNRAIERDYLPKGDSSEACSKFRGEYPGLDGVVTLSRIGTSDDGEQALVHILHQCGRDGRRAEFLALIRHEEIWQVTEEIAATAGRPMLIPQLSYGKEAEGCGDIFLYKYDRTRSEYIVVSIDAAALNPTSVPLSVDLATQSEATSIWIDVYPRSVEQLAENPYCSDVGPAAEPKSTWQAVSGTAVVTITDDAETELCTGEPYQTTVILNNVTFALDKETVTLPALTFADVTVGWCAG